MYNGVVGTSGGEFAYGPGQPFSWYSKNIFNCTLTYSGQASQVLSLTVSEYVAGGASASWSWNNINARALLGCDEGVPAGQCFAYFGMTGGTGADFARQVFMSFTCEWPQRVSQCGWNAHRKAMPRGECHCVCKVSRIPATLITLILPQTSTSTRPRLRRHLQAQRQHRLRLPARVHL